jgi:hypothetical protein
MAKRILKQELKTDDGAFTIKYWEDGALTVVPNKTPKAQAEPHDYWTAQGMILLAVEQGKIKTYSELQAKARSVGWHHTKLESTGYVKHMGNRYHLTIKGKKRLDWIKIHTWQDVI